ncbi:MAG: Asp-tRNA(Asn)/Glu-tRNA(Gln) amidotransferase GatCAB subunit A, partial [Bacteroidetes bacterium]
DYLAPPEDRPYTIGYIREAIDSPGLDPDVRATVLEWMDRIRAAGHHLKEVHFPYLDHVVPCYYVLTTAEASSNLSRFDGVRYGYRSASPETLEELYVRSRTEGFGPEVKKRIMLGSFVLSSGYYDAYYNQAMKVRRLIRSHTEQLLEECDFLLTPTSPTPAFRLGEKSDDPIAMFLSDIYTVHANLAGVPAISLPVGQTPAGLPIGIQFMGRHFEEDRLFAFSRKLTQEI